MMQHADTTAAERIRLPSTEEEGRKYYFGDRQRYCGIHSTFRWGSGRVGPRRIRFTVVLYLLDRAVSHDILKKPAIQGIQLS